MKRIEKEKKRSSTEKEKSEGKEAKERPNKKKILSIFLLFILT